MKIVVSINAKENSAINDVLGSFGTEIRTKEFIKNGKLDATAKGIYNPFGGFAAIVSIPDWVVLGTAQVAMANKAAIKGLIKAIDGICTMADAVVNGIRKDFTKMVEDHYNK